jgi:tRNA threonylcarbamoyladenosine biosynthesis protein TsaE
VREDARLVLHTHGEEETRALGVRLAGALCGGERIGLAGELGAGKTCLVRGIAEGLGIPPRRVVSPSFTILAIYEGGRLPLHHIDLFRLAAGAGDMEELRESMYGRGVCAIEWFEHLAEPLEDWLEISLTFVGPDSRRLVAAAHGVGYDRAMAVLAESEWR